MTAVTVLLISAAPREQAEVRAALDSVHGKPYRLEVVSSLADGLVRLKTGPLDAILLDLDLPDSRGATSFLRIQPKATNIPIVALVDDHDEDIGHDVLKRGALDFLRKDQISGHLIDKVLRYATERTHTLLALRASEQRYRELFQNVTAGVFQTTPDGKFMAANPALVRMLGYDSEDELLSLDVSRDIYMDPEHRDTWTRTMAESGEVRNAELLLKRKDGTKVVVLENSRAVRDAEGRVLFYEGTLTDITAAHELSQQLSYDASHDPLTGLVNRREFELRLQRALEMSQATGATHAVCFLDLDRFKVINDSAGHVAGDELLRQLGQRLQLKVRANDVVARLGGDEFGLLLHSCGPNDAIQLANNLLKDVDEYQFVWGASTFGVGVSIGLVAINNTFKRIAQVMNAADTACYAAKDAGRGRLYVYQEDASLIARRHGEMEWLARAKRALTEHRLYLDVQKILPLTPRERRTAAFRAPGADARRIRAFRPAGRVPPRGRAPQSLGALRPLGVQCRHAVAQEESGRDPARLASVHQPVARHGRRSGDRSVSAARIRAGGSRSAALRLRGGGGNRDRQPVPREPADRRAAEAGMRLRPRRLRQRRLLVRLSQGARRRLPQDRRDVRRQHLRRTRSTTRWSARSRISAT